MTTYQVQVKFRRPDGPKDGIWIPVAASSKKDDVRQYVSMWQHYATHGRNISEVRVMNDGKEVKL